MAEPHIAVVGATGLLGQALMQEARRRGWRASGLARHHADICCDISDDAGLRTQLAALAPDVVVNAVAITSLDLCEKNPGDAYRVNARAVGVLSDACVQIGARFVHVSTDHYFCGDGRLLHDESAPVRLMNEYARSKYLGECLALLNPANLVLRTNIVGFRGWAGQPTFVEWAIESLRQAQVITLFTDFYTSSLDVRSFSQSLFDLLATEAAGVVNLASREVSSKAEFITGLAGLCGLPTAQVKTGSVKDLPGTPRADSLGLDMSRAERWLGRKMPDLQQVLESLAREYGEMQCNTIA